MMEATVCMYKTLVSIYGMHGGNKWDDLPFTHNYNGYEVRVNIRGEFIWGPFMYRKNSVKQHIGVSEVAYQRVYSWRNYKESGEGEKECLQKAEDMAILLAINFEKADYAVNLSILTHRQDEAKESLLFNWENGSPPSWLQEKAGHAIVKSINLP